MLPIVHMVVAKRDVVQKTVFAFVTAGVATGPLYVLVQECLGIEVLVAQGAVLCLVRVEGRPGHCDGLYCDDLAAEKSLLLNIALSDPLLSLLQLQKSP